MEAFRLLLRSAIIRGRQGMSMSAIKLMIRGLEGTTVTLTLARNQPPRAPPLAASQPASLGIYDVCVTRTVAPLDDAQMAVYADVAEAVSCLDGRDDVMLDLLRQKHASRHAAAPHRAFNHFIAVLGTPVGAQALGDDLG